MTDSAALIVLIGIFAILVVLALDKMRPGFTLFAGATAFMAMGIITPEELLDGFSNREMVTIALLFLIGEGVRQSGALNYLIRHILPQKSGRVGWLMGRILPVIASISMVLNNTAVVIIFAPIIKRWSQKIGLPASKFLIPLSYAAILGGLCTLVGTSTNMVVNGLMIESGYRGFGMFEIGKVGVVIAVLGVIYLMIFGNMLLPDHRESAATNDDDEVDEVEGRKITVEIILASRFPGMGKSLKEFDFERHYGARVKAIRRSGERIDKHLDRQIFTFGDTLVLSTDDAFTRTWRESSAFHIVSDSAESIDDELAQPNGGQRWLGLSLLIFLVGGVTLGEWFGGLGGGGELKFEIFPMAAVVMVIMAVARLFPAKRYTKYISWDILVAIASAFAISRAISNSGINELVAMWIISITKSVGTYGVLALLYLVTMALTELITNNAAVAIAFPIAVALSQQLGVDPMPLFVAICIAASASFSSPIGYQTNLIVQGVGGYKFRDYVRVGIWLNLITFITSVVLIPMLWEF
ncbi:MAG: SLC13 family permease [Rikenellaceae bacterium]